MQPLPPATAASAGRAPPCDGGTVGGGPADGIAFNIDTTCWPDNGVREVELAYKLTLTSFRQP